MGNNVLDFILLGYALNGVAFVIVLINLIATAIFDFGSIVQANLTTKKESHFWKIIIPYYTAYRVFSLYAMYGVKNGFNTAKMVQDRENDRR